MAAILVTRAGLLICGHVIATRSAAACSKTNAALVTPLGARYTCSFFWINVIRIALITRITQAADKHVSNSIIGDRVIGAFCAASFFSLTIMAVVVDVAGAVVHRCGIGWAFRVLALLAATRCGAVFVCRTDSTDARRFT